MPPPTIEEITLTRGQFRTLNARRQTVGDETGERAFAEWPVVQSRTGRGEDRRDPLTPDKQDGLTVPRGCPIKRGRDRTVVEFVRRLFLPDDRRIRNSASRTVSLRVAG